ncbi:MraY family glycosyltransferase [uncultured Parabacteroides sp.]|jgi:UDP-N-acetylmuramyl pentapeptide phosphotransferase/UDP-N-acetylglucosamine-1-phosphate transferase|uniref:glycosyltransferase family 4 protein n=1 Tax=uncultured Parabacteroides sp. TaxID=512312 RepID=UPI0025D7A122|nr:MraY family glycosyltransferase [uncultured Parabacteroides sp.]
MLTASLLAIMGIIYGEPLKGKISIFLCLVLSFVFSFVFLPQIMKISKRKQLYDIPNSRKSHNEKVPRLGGIAFFPSIVLSMSLVVGYRYLIGFPLNEQLTGNILLEFLFLSAGCLFLFMVGVEDDLIGVRYRKKFLTQFLVASLLPISGFYLTNLSGLFGLYELPVYVGIPLTILLIVFITNAVNLIDGIDGLAAGGSTFSFVVIGWMFFQKGLWLYSMLAFSAAGCLIPFLYFNIWGRASKGTKMFMGDAGSLSLGFLLSFLIIKFPLYISETEPDIKNLVIPFTLLFIPMFDACRVMIVRAIQHKPIFLADRNHLHHKCLAAGMTHLQATELVLVFTIGLLIVNNWLVDVCNINVLLVVDLLLGIGLSKSLNLRIRYSQKKS